MVNHDEPSQQCCLQRQGWLDLAVAKTGDDPKDNVARHRCSRVEIPRNSRETGLVQVTRRSDEVDQVVENVGKDTPFIGERS